MFRHVPLLLRRHLIYFVFVTADNSMQGKEMLHTPWTDPLLLRYGHPFGI